MRINVFKSGGNSAEGGFVSNGLTLQGPLILSGPHTDHLHAVPKQYVDNAIYNLDANNITSGVLAAGRLPAFSGDATTILGTSNIVLANTGVTPGSIIKPTVDAKGRVLSAGSLIESDISGISFEKINVGRPTTLNGYGITDAVSISNNVTMQGDLILSGQPTSNEHAATKNYVDTAAGVAGGISVGDIIRKPYTTTPTGFLKCNGAEVDKTTYANLYSVIGDTFANDLTPGSGKPWQQQYKFNDSQVNDILGWTIGTGLPGVLSHSTLIATKNRVYLLGGFTGSGAYVSTVYTAVINADGTLGAWTTGTSLPIGLLGSTGFVTNGKVFLVGGATGTGTYLSNVYTATINSDGTIGTWVSAPSLPAALGYARSIVTKNRVYTISGHNGSSAISTIYTAVINDDGTIGAWSVHGTIPYAAYLSYVAVIKDRVYLIGGYNNAFRKDVYYANIDSNGVLGSWNVGIPLPKGMSHGECFVSKNKIYLTFENEVYSSNINSDGSIGTWSKNSTLPYNMAENECLITSSKIYLISSAGGSYYNYVIYSDFSGGLNDYSGYYGGTDASINYLIPGCGKPWQQQYQINNAQSADITGWSTSGTLPVSVLAPQAIVTKNRIYLIGGDNTTTSAGAISSVYTAPINADGTLGTWSASTSLPGALSRSTSVITKNRVYIIGGWNGTSAVSSIYTATINADGTLGAWSTTTSFPIAIYWTNCVAIKNKLYTFGGINSSSVAISSIYSATINSDGTIDTWTNVSSLPTSVNSTSIALTKNKIYLIGGHIGGTYLNNVYVASINSDGTLGAWSSSYSLPSVVSTSQVFVTKNTIYLLGGSGNSSTPTTIVYKTSISSDGSIGAWTTSTSLSSALSGSQAIVTKDHVYLLGGSLTTWPNPSNTIIGAPISDGLNDYSSYYNGTIQPVSTVSTKFKLPDYTLLDKEFGDLVTSYIKF